MESPDDRSDVRGRRAAAAGLLANVGLAAAKLIAGLAGHSYALVADAAESIVDIVGSAVIWGGLHYSARPADQRHPYGHGKAEALAALAVALLVFGTGVGIGIEAARRIVSPGQPPAAFTLWVLLGVVAIKEGLFRLLRRAGDGAHSPALAAEAWHHRSDAITSAAAAAGITAAVWGGIASADGWAALVAAGVIVLNGLRIARSPLHELMDAEPTGVVERAGRAAAGVARVANVEKTLARKSGGRYWVDMHVRVDPLMSVREAHEVAHEVKDRVREALPRVQDVLVHIEPADRGGPGGDDRPAP